jgi:hypothetical protein
LFSVATGETLMSAQWRARLPSADDQRPGKPADSTHLNSVFELQTQSALWRDTLLARYRYEAKSFIDLNRYAGNDFLVTMRAYEGRYESRGKMDRVYRPAAAVFPWSAANRPDSEEIWVAGPPDFDSIMDSVRQGAIVLGGNGIMNFRMTAHFTMHHNGPRDQTMVPDIEVSGLVIHRTDRAKSPKPKRP